MLDTGLAPRHTAPSPFHLCCISKHSSSTPSWPCTSCLSSLSASAMPLCWSVWASQWWSPLIITIRWADHCSQLSQLVWTSLGLTWVICSFDGDHWIHKVCFCKEDKYLLFEKSYQTWVWYLISQNKLSRRPCIHKEVSRYPEWQK